jgi:alpha-glucosidase
MLALYRAALRLRRSVLTTEYATEPTFAWLPGDPSVLAFTRGDRFACVVNLGAESVVLPAGAVLITSHDLDDGRLPPDAAAWIHLAEAENPAQPSSTTALKE